MAYFYNRTLTDAFEFEGDFTLNGASTRNNLFASVYPVYTAPFERIDFEGTNSWVDHDLDLTALLLAELSKSPDFAPSGPLFANINGDGGNNVINGTSGADVIHGNGGDDIINGLGTADQIFGDAGNDTMILINGQGSDNFDGGTGIDTLDFSGFITAITFDLAGETYNFGTAISIENVIAGSAGDTIIGTSGANDLDGRGGNDTISGGAGDDIIDGGTGNDLLEGGFNTDTISGGAGNDTIFAMTQADPNGSTVGDILRGNAGDDIITGSGGDDTIFVGTGADTANGNGGNDTFDMGDGFDPGTVSDLDGGSGTDLFVFSTYSSSYSINLTTGEWRQSNNNLLATLTNIENVTAGNGADVITGSASSNVLNGGGGNDILDGEQGNDTVNGGAGDDTMIIGQGDGLDSFDGGTGTDLLDLSDFDATVSLSVDLAAGTYNFGTVVNTENVIGGTGNDNITGSAGDNVLSGGAGADTLDGGAGTDTLDYSDSDAAVTVALGAPSASGGHADGDVISNFENVTGSAFDDSLTGNGLSNTLMGGLGNDTLIIGGANADSALGGDGDDLLRISSFSPTHDAHIFDGGNDTDTFSFSTFGGDYEVNLNSGSFNNLAGTGNASSLISIENVEAGSGDDTITGTNGDNIINGNGGNDVINSGAGNDTVNGGAGDDEFIDNQGTGAALASDFDGGSGIDIFRSEVNWSGNVIFDLSAGEQRSGVTVYDTFTNIENLSIGGAADAIGDANANEISFVNTGVGQSSNTVDGGAGDDIINTNNGDDFVTGGAGADTMDGGTGTDTLDYTGSSAGVQINLAANTALGGDAAGDVISNFEAVEGSAFDDVLFSTDLGFGPLNGNDGNDILFITGGLNGSTLNGGNGDDVLVSAITMNGSSLNGGAGNDNITATSDLGLVGAFDTANGGTGNDIIFVGGGGDVLDMELDGGADIDTLSLLGLAPGYTVDLGAGTLVNNGTGNAATQVINFENATGGNGADTITGTAGNNIIVGGGGADVINGGAGNDILYGDLTASSTGASDTINGGAGADLIIYARDGSSGANVDANDGGSGIDTFVMSNISSARLVDLTAGNWNLGDINGASSVRGTLTNIENVLIEGEGDVDVRGDALDNTISFTSLTASNEVEGMAGDDTIVTGGGDDRVEGGAGSDIMDGGDDIDTLDYAGSAVGVNVNMLTGAVSGGDAAGDTFSNFENLFGSQLNDILTGDMGANLLSGADGNDRLDGGAGDDTLSGDFGADTIFGGAGADINFGGAGFDSMDFRGATSRVALDVTTGGTVGDAAGDTYLELERYYLSDFNDTITGSAANEFFYGEDGNDTINAGDGIDRLYGGDGNDIQRGQGGNDQLYGSAGADQLNGGTGFDIANYSDATGFVSLNLGTGGTFGDAAGDTYFGIEAVYGSDFNDILAGNNSSNELRGGLGDDILNGSGGSDRLFGEAGADALNGGTGVDIAFYTLATSGVTVHLVNGGTVGDAAGDSYSSVEWVFGSDFNDVITGDAGINRLEGRDGDDTLNGGDGNDRLLGGDGNDIINGGNGVDTIFGQGGSDTLIGAGGNDFFFGSSGGDSMNGGLDFDTASYLPSGAGVVVNLQTGGTGGDANGDTYVSIERVFGSQQADSITGSNGANTLLGNGGDDYLDGGLGNDSLFGGAGTDSYGFNTTNGDGDTISGFVEGSETIYILGGDAAFDTFAEISAVATDVGANVRFDFGGGNTLTIIGKNLADLSAGDFDFSGVAPPAGEAPSASKLLVSEDLGPVSDVIAPTETNDVITDAVIAEVLSGKAAIAENLGVISDIADEPIIDQDLAAAFMAEYSEKAPIYYVDGNGMLAMTAEGDAYTDFAEVFDVI